MIKDKYFNELMKKLNNIESYIEKISINISKIENTVNQLAKDAKKGDTKEVNNVEHSKPIITCDVTNSGLIIPREVSMSIDHPIHKALEDEGIHGIRGTIIWFAQHIINVDIILIDKNNACNKYYNALIKDVYTNSILNNSEDKSIARDDIAFTFDNYSSSEEEFIIDPKKYVKF